MRLRVGVWHADRPKGTIVLFPGRTEYLEKYGRVAIELTRAGYCVLAIDWRGQGFSDRITDDPRVGHVKTFQDYQKDVSALFEAAIAYDLPKPWHMIAHSMGGCIGLRALLNDAPVERVVFSAPMWGIFVPKHLRPIARVLQGLARIFGISLWTMPGTHPTNYVTDTALADNLLTTDEDTYAYLARQAEAGPEYALGGPTIHWFAEARKETAALRAGARPEYPVLTIAGTDEGIVDRKALSSMHENWASARLMWVEGAKHELMMEAPLLRQQFMDAALEFLEASTPH